MGDASTTPAILVLTGPTGVGKTDTAFELCRRLGAEIVGADSVQVYREFDIGSCKPSAELRRAVPHHLIDVAAPTAPIDAAEYAALADAAIAGIARRGALPIVVGGTGLWLRALLRGLVELPKVDRELRARLERDFREQGGAALLRGLAEVDPASAARLHPSDQVRIVRALEVHAQTGRALSQLHAEHALGAPRYRALTLLLDRPRGPWRCDVAQRTQAMLAAGLIEEVRGIVQRHGSALRPLRSVGYRQVLEGLARGIAQTEFAESIAQATCLYGKRQRTWFAKDPSVDLRLEPEAALSPAVMEQIRAHFA